MPQGRPELHTKFQIPEHAESVLYTNGWTQEKWRWTPGTINKETDDAIEYLITEWDHALSDKAFAVFEYNRTKENGYIVNNNLALDDLKGYDSDDLKELLKKDYSASDEELENVNFLISKQYEGPWGCDSSSFFVFSKENKFYVVEGSHCSCFGFEDQWVPREVTLKYLLSDLSELSMVEKYHLEIVCKNAN